LQNSATALSVGVLFCLMITGLSTSLRHALASGLHAQGVPAATATSVAALPPVNTLFAGVPRR
jgi:hypothetical protein